MDRSDSCLNIPRRKPPRRNPHSMSTPRNLLLKTIITTPPIDLVFLKRERKVNHARGRWGRMLVHIEDMGGIGQGSRWFGFGFGFLVLWFGGCFGGGFGFSG